MINVKGGQIGIKTYSSTVDMVDTTSIWKKYQYILLDM